MMPIDLNEDQISHLFDLALEGTDRSREQLSAAELEELTRIQRLLDMVDQAWEITEAGHERMHALLLQKLAATYPDHPWLQGSVVQTLGELVRAGGENLPRLPEQSYAALMVDTTPVEVLRDPAKRTAIAGKAIQNAGVPQTLIRDFMLWLNTALSHLVPKQGEPGLIYPRRQGGPDARK